MFCDQLNSFLSLLILKTNHKKCDWNRYPLCFPLKDSTSQISIRRTEDRIGLPLNSSESFFLSQDNGFVFFLTFGKDAHHLFIQQMISSPLIDVSDYSSLFNKHVSILYRKIQEYIKEKEAFPDSLYHFLSRVVDGDDYTNMRRELITLGFEEEEIPFP